jgi:hypothetical protein
MSRFKETVDRQQGNQRKIFKFHLMLHVIDDIRRFGLPPNFSSGPSKSRHTSHCKSPGQHTQRRTETFISQVQSRHIEHLAVETAISDVTYLNHKRSQPITTLIDDMLHLEASSDLSGYVFQIFKQNWKPYCGRWSKTNLISSNIPSVYKDVMDLLVDKIASQLPEEALPIYVYSEYRAVDGNGIKKYISVDPFISIW